MDRSEVTWCLKQFSALAGKSFRNENPHRLVLKFIIFRFFPTDWQHMFTCCFPADKRIPKQIAALSCIARDKLPRLDDIQWFYVLNALSYQHGVDPSSMQLTIHKQPRPHHVPHYHRFNEEMKSIAASLTPHRDNLFLLQMSEAGYARGILYEDGVMGKLGVDYVAMQRKVMPKLAEGRESDRADKLTELSSILQFARFDLSKLDIAALEKSGTVQSVAGGDVTSATRKHVYSEKLDALMAERDELMETVDEQKLKDNFHEGIKEKLAWRPTGRLTKAQMADACAAMEQALVVLKEVQMEDIDKHRQTLRKIEALAKERAALLRTARQGVLYTEGKHEVIEWKVPTTRNMRYNDAVVVVNKIESHISQLKNYQVEAN
jgi:hypothetical protein